MAHSPETFGADESVELLGFAEQIGRIGLIDWTPATGVVRLSPYAQEMYGITHFDGRYETWISTVFRDDLTRLRNVIASAFEEKVREFELDFRIIRQADKKLRWISARRLAFYDDAGKPVRVLGVSVDITDRKRELAELRSFTETLEEAVKERTRELEAENAARIRAEELLRQAQKMDAVGQLTGGVAHDFNNLLTVVLGGLEMIERQIPAMNTSPAVARIVRGKDMAIEGVRRAAKLTSRLLAFARQQPLEPKNVDANKLVSAVCELLRQTLGEAVQLETVLAGGLWRTFADGNQLENAVVNLAVNARDAMPDGGKLTIETANCYLDEAYAQALAEPVKPGQYVMIAVADTGLGMNRETMERAFEPFFTTKSFGKGTGLGLSQVYGFVRQSSGHVQIYSETGEGTTVKIYLPRASGADEQPEEMDRRGVIGGPFGAETILVVEDDDALRIYAVEVLSDLGYSVLAATNAAAALELIGRRDDIDLLFTDIVMPGGMNGRQLADEAVRQRPGLKVLFTTGYTRNAIVHHGRLDSGVEMIGKPFTLRELSTRIRAILDRH
ncbi:MAG TPA: ATP-binding protein [Pseudolabrys sp.]|nr:ATP-binding protein [Pseudolabrys sp.]